MAHRGRFSRSHAARPSVDELLVDRRIIVGDHDYLVDRKIGQYDDRSFAFQVSDSNRNRQVLRVFDKHWVADSKLEQSLVELHNASGLAPYEYAGTFMLRHPSLKGFSRGSSIQLFALVRQFEKQTLKDAADVGEDKAFTIARDVALGVRSLHHAGIAHGDLKPGNILIDSNSDARVADYLLAAYSLVPSNDDFTAPEQRAGSEKRPAHPSMAGDIYSFGRIIQLLRLNSVGPASNGAILKLLEACLSGDPAVRPTIDQIIDTIFSQLQPSEIDFTHFVQEAARGAEARLNVAPKAYRVSTPEVKIHDAATELTEFSRTPASHRLRPAEHASLVHLLSSTAFLNGLSKLYTKSSHCDTLASMEYVSIQALKSTPLDEESAFRIRSQFEPLSRDELEAVEELRGVIPDDDIDRMLSLEDGESRSLHLAARMRDAIEARNLLLEQFRFIRSEGVAELLSIACPGITGEEVGILCDAGRLLSVPVGGASMYPTFQFEEGADYLPFGCMRDIRDQLGGAAASPWGVLAWWGRPNLRLGGVSPSSYLVAGGSEDQLLKLAAPLYPAA